ncbi:hypothetical protein V2G26_006320 [Clonostachys chloroleuca]
MWPARTRQHLIVPALLETRHNNVHTTPCFRTIPKRSIFGPPRRFLVAGGFYSFSPEYSPFSLPIFSLLVPGFAGKDASDLSGKVPGPQVPATAWPPHSKDIFVRMYLC